jgi:hypothetical protein
MSPHFGLKLRILGLTLFFPCGILYPVFVCIGSAGFGTFVAGHCAVDLTPYHFFKDTKEIVVEYENFLRNSVYNYCHQMIYPPLGETVRVYDISFQLMFICLFASAIGFILNFILAILISIIYVIPVIFKWEYLMVKSFCELGSGMILVLVPFIIALFLAPVGITVAFAAFPFGFAIIGLDLGINTYQSSFGEAFSELRNMVTEVEKFIREFIINGK